MQTEIRKKNRIRIIYIKKTHWKSREINPEWPTPGHILVKLFDFKEQEIGRITLKLRLWQQYFTIKENGYIQIPMKKE